jgi:hypothetical protein
MWWILNLVIPFLSSPFPVVAPYPSQKHPKIFHPSSIHPHLRPKPESPNSSQFLHNVHTTPYLPFYFRRPLISHISYLSSLTPTLYTLYSSHSTYPLTHLCMYTYIHIYIYTSPIPHYIAPHRTTTMCLYIHIYRYLERSYGRFSLLFRSLFSGYYF